MDRRALACVLTVLILAGGVEYAPAQGLPGIPWLESPNSGGVRIIPEIQIGCQNLALNFNLPAALLQSPLPPYPSTLDLQIGNANLWVGSLSAALLFPSGWSFGMIGRANAKRDILVNEREEHVLGGEQGVTWTGSQLEWWMIEARFLYRFTTGCSVMFGVKRDHLAVNLRDPRDPAGNPLNFDEQGEILGFPYDRHQRYYSDLMSKLWVPYVGLEIVGPGYRACVLGSPFAAVEMKIPAALLFDLRLVTQLIYSESLLYRVARPGVFLEGTFQYDLNFAPNFTVGLWCSGTWMSLKGPGSWNFDSMIQTLPFPAGFDSQSQENPASYTKTMLGGGVSAVLSF